MYENLSLGSNCVTCSFHPTAQVDVGAKTVGQFSNDFLAENGRRISIPGHIFIHESVKFLGIPNFHRTSEPMFIENLWAPHDNTGWRNGGTSNQNWPVIPGVAYHNISVAWRGAIPDRPAYMPLSPENSCADAQCCAPLSWLLPL